MRTTRLEAKGAHFKAIQVAAASRRTAFCSTALLSDDWLCVSDDLRGKSLFKLEKVDVPETEAVSEGVPFLE